MMEAKDAENGEQRAALVKQAVDAAPIGNVLQPMNPGLGKRISVYIKVDSLLRVFKIYCRCQ
jgi:hypothetical protein